MRELESSIKRLGKVPQSAVTKAARQGMNIALKAAREKAPVDTGDLKGGIIIKAERKTVTGKKVYDVMMDPKKNPLFVKMSADGQKRYYYPASQEYGFMNVDGGYTPGYRFLRNALTENAEAIEQKIVGVMGKEIDKALAKR
ncbi:HK97-gp10 family putative phage morphogenesis protein [Paenibacillus sp.]|uniref:HK97-gp10 family putative phage morphogenesis protein n=1 Tax=Paenibacillus sp. TaxID=58172 RepID=UPI002D5017A3|nr:HK97-gp10 family putative phage morphogenesis protein [Paenibacillus sp.]HZG83834.1 HK97-gp10 family putative phage morphogenesis protein [Paenibacillus sp.]